MNFDPHSNSDQPNAVTTTVDGRLSGESVAAVYTRTIRAIELGKAVRLFLGDIMEIDQNGRKLLSRLVMLGVRVTATESKFLDRCRNQPFAGPSKVGRTISYSEIGIDGTRCREKPANRRRWG